MKLNLGKIKVTTKINFGCLSLGTKKVYPELENLSIIPSGFEQHFKSEKYGYNIVDVEAVSSDILNIVPTSEKQKYQGLFNTVNIDPIKIQSEDWYEEEVEAWT